MTVVRSSERVRPARGETPGFTSEEVFSTQGIWVGILKSTPGDMSGWHHHGEYETYAYVVSGVKTVEHGCGGRERLTADPGDFIHLPKLLVHRD